MSFKLLAIRPMPGTDSKFLKNLKPGVIYKFYQEYGYYTDDKKTTRVDNLPIEEQKNHIVNYVTQLTQEIPDNLYSTEGGPSINISAVVGKNGSGKSALIEFYLRSLYLISKNLKILDLDKEKKNIEKLSEDTFLKLKQVFRGYGEKLDYFVRDIDHELLKSFSSNLYNMVSWKKQINNLNNPKNIFESEKQKFKGCIYYLADSKVVLIKINNNKITIVDENDHSSSDFKSKVNHYNILTNYSIYGLNSHELGSWVNVLFHKNDGYETPLVINPMKSNGIIDVNNDMRLNKIRSIERFLDTESILDKKINKVILDLGFKSKDTKIRLIEKQDKIYEIKYNNSSFNDFFYFIETSDGNELNQISNKLNPNENERNAGYTYRKKTIEILNNFLSDIHYKKILLPDIYEFQYFSLFHYFLDKLYRFKVNYLNDFSDIDNLSEFVKKNIISDNTHKTFKLRQCLYYFKINVFSKLFPDWTKSKPFAQKISLDIIEIKSNIIDFKLDENSDGKINEYKIPITFFNIDFEFEDGSKYSELSSGQIQLLNSLATAYYHIKNIDSKHNENSKNIESINLIFDEVELYFHPDFQRIYVSEVINLLKKSKFKFVNTFNLLFLTHSPFILSDIPSQNILRLEDGKPVKSKNDTNSFAANIHDLLADEFFLEDGFMGEFAKGKIQNLLNSKKKITENDMKVVELIGDQFVKSVLKSKLLSKVKTQELLDREIEKREKELSKLKAKRDASN